MGAVVEQKKLPVTVDHSVCGKEKDAEDIALSSEKGIRNVVVFLQSPPPGAKWPVALPIVQMDQEQCMFVPRVVVVPAGGTVEFLNSDRLLHNLHSDSKGIPASTGRNREAGRFPSCSRTGNHPGGLRPPPLDAGLGSGRRSSLLCAH